MSHPIIEVNDLSKRYRLGQVNARSLHEEAERMLRRLTGRGAEAPADAADFWALRDVSFSVQPGEVVGIVGRNGAGKSTLLKILSRVTEPTSGQVRIRGRVASLLEVGTGFHPELTGRENVYLNGAILGMTRAEITAKFDEIVDFSEVEQFLDTPVKRYSSGMYVRLAFAVAAHLEPEVLIVDEVLAVGDVAFQRKCLGKMKDVSAREGRTVLFVSHNMNAILDLCTRGIFFKGGAIEEDGNINKVVSAYINAQAVDVEQEIATLPHTGKREFVRFQSVELFDIKRREASAFSMGDTILARVRLHCLQAMPEAEIGLKISNQSGAVVHYFSSRWEGIRRDLEPGNHVFDVEIPQLALYPGSYVVGVWALSEPDLSAGDNNIPAVKKFTVLKGDVTGHPTRMEHYNTSGGIVYARSSWIQRTSALQGAEEATARPDWQLESTQEGSL